MIRHLITFNGRLAYIQSNCMSFSRTEPRGALKLKNNTVRTAETAHIGRLRSINENELVARFVE